MKERSDNELLKAYAEGVTAAFDVLYLRHRSRLFNYVFAMVKSVEMADDIVQESFIKAHSVLQAGMYKDEGKFVQWIMRIAHNLVIDHYRKSQKFKLVYSNADNDIFEVLDTFDDSAESIIIKKQIHKDVRMLVKLLPEEQRRVLVMRLYADMSFKEIAERTGVSINTALGRMRYALINMRKLAEERSVVLAM